MGGWNVFYAIPGPLQVLDVSEGILDGFVQDVARMNMAKPIAIQSLTWASITILNGQRRLKRPGLKQPWRDSDDVKN